MPREVKEYIIEVYADKQGKEPFTLWFDNLDDMRAKARIAKRLDRVTQGILATASQ